MRRFPTAVFAITVLTGCSARDVDQYFDGGATIYVNGGANAGGSAGHTAAGTNSQGGAAGTNLQGGAAGASPQGGAAGTNLQGGAAGNATHAGAGGAAPMAGAGGGGGSSLCGNGAIDAGESCDGDVFGAATCATAVGTEAIGVLVCADDCTFDTSACRWCGDGKIDQSNEQCDGVTLTDDSCATVTGHDDAEGALACTAACTVDASGCSFCGDGNVTGGEDCDGANLHGATCATLNGGSGVGALACHSGTCTFDASGCTFCGDGVVNGGEQCDGAAFATASPTCAELAGVGSSGTVACTASCAYDLTMCTAPAGCDGLALDAGEACDGAFFPIATTCASATKHGEATGSVTCTAQCQLDIDACAYCGDGQIGFSEVCDPTSLEAAESCLALTGDPSSTGVAACRSDCTGFDPTNCAYCGDGVRNNAEGCDGAQLGGASCQGDHGSSASGSYACSATCTIDRSACLYCGDAIVQNGEACDGNVGAATCATIVGLGATGTLRCTPGCAWDTSGCVAPASCGNGVVDAGEQCDGNASVTTTCAAQTGVAGATGAVGCSATCRFDLTQCSYCGNGRIDPGEQCDGVVPAGTTCPTSQQGTPTCTSACAISDASCSCAAGTTMCNGFCVNTASDSANCGGCGLACKGGQSCNGKLCTAAVITTNGGLVDFAVDQMTLVGVSTGSLTVFGSKDGAGGLQAMTPFSQFTAIARLAMDDTNYYVMNNATAGCTIGLIARANVINAVEIAGPPNGYCTGINAIAAQTSPSAMWSERNKAGTYNVVTHGNAQGSSTIFLTTQPQQAFTVFFGYGISANSYGFLLGANASPFLNNGHGPDGGPAVFAPYDATSTVTDAIFVLATNSTFWLQGTSVYYAANGAAHGTPVYTSPGTVPLAGVAGDAKGVFWGDPGAGEILEAAPDGSGAHVLAVVNGTIGRIALDDQFAYWLVNPGANAALYRTPR